MTRTPREVVEMYNYELWNGKRFELADELIGDSVIRHEVGAVTTLTHAEASNRVVERWSQVQSMKFTLNKVISEGEYVTIVFEADVTLDSGQEVVIGSMEIYRVVEGRICEVWNVGPAPGRWQ